jgi:hypothetical protein
MNVVLKEGLSYHLDSMLITEVTFLKLVVLG